MLALTHHSRTQAFEDGFSQEDIFEYTKIDPWFVAQFWEMHQAESWLKTQKLEDISAFDMLQAKKRGFSDSQIARFTGVHATSPVCSTACLPASNMGDASNARGVMHRMAFVRVLYVATDCCARTYPQMQGLVVAPSCDAVLIERRLRFVPLACRVEAAGCAGAAEGAGRHCVVPARGHVRR